MRPEARMSGALRWAQVWALPVGQVPPELLLPEEAQGVSLRSLSPVDAVEEVVRLVAVAQAAVAQAVEAQADGAQVEEALVVGRLLAEEAVVASIPEVAHLEAVSRLVVGPRLEVEVLRLRLRHPMGRPGVAARIERSSGMHSDALHRCGGYPAAARRSTARHAARMGGKARGNQRWAGRAAGLAGR